MRGALVLLALTSCSTPKHLQGLRQSDVQDAIVSHRSELGRCVAEQRQRAPGSSGKVLLRFRILPTGESTDIVSPSGGPAELVSCFSRVLSSVRFPSTDDPGEPMTYPLQY